MSLILIGLDRGSHSVKAVLLERGFRGNELKGVRSVSVPQNGLEPPSEEAIRAAVTDLIAEFDPGQVGYVVDFPGMSASSWFLSLPFTDQRKVDQTLPFELENFVAADLEEMVLDYRIVAQDDGKSRVMAALAAKDEVARTLSWLKGIKVDPRALVLDTYALAYVPPGRDAEDKGTAIVDLGHTKTQVVVRVEGVPDFVRTIGMGGLNITQALMNRFGVNYATAEQMKKVMGPVEAIPDATWPTLNALEPLPLAESFATDIPTEIPPDIRLDALEPLSDKSAAQGLSPDPSADGTEEGIEVLSDVVEEETEDTTIGVRSRLDRVLETPPGRTPGGFDEAVSVDSEPLDWFRRESSPDSASSIDWLTPPSPAPLSQLAELDASPQAALEPPPANLPDAVEVKAVIDEVLALLLLEVRNALIAYEGAERREIGAVLLVGGTSMFEGLAERLEAEIGVKVGRPIRLGPEQMSLEANETQLLYAKAFGLAFMGATDAKAGEINFRKGEFSYQKSYRAMRRYVLVAVALLVLGVMAGVGYFAKRLGALSEEQKALDAQIAELVKSEFPELEQGKGMDMTISLLREQQSALEAKADLLGVSDSRRTSLDVLKEVSELAPPREEVKLDVEDWTFEGNQVKLRGTADKFESIDKFETALKESRIIQDTKNEVGSRGDKKNFNLVITLGEPGEVVVEPPEGE